MLCNPFPTLRWCCTRKLCRLVPQSSMPLWRALRTARRVGRWTFAASVQCCTATSTLISTPPGSTRTPALLLSGVSGRFGCYYSFHRALYLQLHQPELWQLDTAGDNAGAFYSCSLSLPYPFILSNEIIDITSFILTRRVRRCWTSVRPQTSTFIVHNDFMARA